MVETTQEMSDQTLFTFLRLHEQFHRAATIQDNLARHRNANRFESCALTAGRPTSARLLPMIGPYVPRTDIPTQT